MSREDVELVRSICAAWGRGDYSSAEWAHPEIEFVIADGPAPGRWTGLAAMADGWGSWLRAWDEFRQEAEEYRVLDEERVLVLFRGHGRAKASGLELAQMYLDSSVGLFDVQNGRITRFAVYFDREHAFADLGLEG